MSGALESTFIPTTYSGHPCSRAVVTSFLVGSISNEFSSPGLESGHPSANSAERGSFNKNKKETKGVCVERTLYVFLKSRSVFRSPEL